MLLLRLAFSRFCIGEQPLPLRVWEYHSVYSMAGRADSAPGVPAEFGCLDTISLMA